ncbi:MAG: hypothetical protein ACYDDF_15085 [Thermoplasmatota archaeon]
MWTGTCAGGPDGRWHLTLTPASGAFTPGNATGVALYRHPTAPAFDHNWTGNITLASVATGSAGGTTPCILVVGLAGLLVGAVAGLLVARRRTTST